MVGPATQQRIQERGKGNGKGERAEVIDFFHPALNRLVQKYGDQQQGGGTDRHVDVENPAPRHLIDEITADKRAEQACHGPNGREDAHHFAALLA